MNSGVFKQPIWFNRTNIKWPNFYEPWFNLNANLKSLIFRFSSYMLGFIFAVVYADMFTIMQILLSIYGFQMRNSWTFLQKLGATYVVQPWIL